ncbi:MAG: sce7726 family protein [Flavobacteriaceae bacterium]
MNPKREKDLNLLRDYSSLFTRSEAISMINGNFSSINKKIHRHSKNIPNTAVSSYSKFLKHAYQVLENSYRNEYVFKNSFITYWLINELGKSDSVVFNEFRAGNSVADLAMFNGLSKAFEIKTEYDSDQRLSRQIENYKQVFNETYLIIPKSKVDLYKKNDPSIGIILFDDDKNNKFEFLRKAVIKEDLNPLFLMQILNTNEYREIVKSYYGELPKMNSFNQYKTCFELIKKIPIGDFNQLCLEQIKMRKLENVLSEHSHKELNQICLSLKLKKKEKRSLIENLKKPIQF